MSLNDDNKQNKKNKRQKSRQVRGTDYNRKEENKTKKLRGNYERGWAVLAVNLFIWLTKGTIAYKTTTTFYINGTVFLWLRLE